MVLLGFCRREAGEKEVAMLKKLADWAVQIVSISLFMLALAATAKGQSVNYHLLKKVPLGAAAGGGEYFDYLTAEPSARRIYVSHGTEVVVVDADSGAVVGKTTGLKRCHGIALAEGTGKGFITDGDEGKVFVFDVKTLKITGEIKTDKDSDSIIYDPASKRIFAFNGDPHTASVIDPASGAVVKTIELGGGPEFAVADGKGTVYNNLEDKNEVVAIDTQTLTIKSRWPVAPAGAPTAMTMDREHGRLFSAGRNPQMVVMLDADSGKVLQSLPISAGVDAAAFEEQTGLLFVSTREGMVHIFHEDSPAKLSVVQTLKTEYGAKTMALDTKTHNLYLSTAEFSEPPAGQANGRRSPKPGTFHLLIYAR
jgi:outer membrane protein assembly factor BamB